jgi:hypothetical protein
MKRVVIYRKEGVNNIVELGVIALINQIIEIHGLAYSYLRVTRILTTEDF